VGGAAAVHFVTEFGLDSASVPLDADADADAKDDDDDDDDVGGGDDKINSECVLEQSSRSQPLDRPRTGGTFSRCTASHVGDAAAQQVDCSSKASNMLSSPTSSKRDASACVMVECGM
jgi:hypothetical protein